MSDNIYNKIKAGSERSFNHNKQRNSPKCTNLKNSVQEEVEALNRSKLTYYEEIIKDLIHYRGLRQKFSNKVFRFLTTWCICVLALILLSGFFDTFKISDAVLVTLCGGTTVSAIGLVGFIVQGLFNNKTKK